MWSSDQTAATESPFGALGMMVVNDTAAALGITGIPGPTADTDAPWFVWEPLQTRIAFGTAVGFDEPAGYIATVDSKAMRKVGPNEDVVVVGGNAHATFGAGLQLEGRMLVKLH